MISLTGRKPSLVKGKRPGFTFIELMLVAILIGVIVGISTPIFRRTFGHLQLDSTCHNIAKLMRYVQQRAVVERGAYRLKFDSSRRTYWLEVERAEEGPLLKSKGFEPVKGRFGKRYPIPRGISVTFREEMASAITFYPDGQADKVALYITDKKGKSYTLITERRIGRVKLVEGRQK